MSTEIPVQGKLIAKTGKRTIRDTLPAAKVYGTTGQLTGDDLDRLPPTSTPVQSEQTAAVQYRTTALATAPDVPRTNHTEVDGYTTTSGASNSGPISPKNENTDGTIYAHPTWLICWFG